MPQLVPFYFVNQVTFAFIILLLLIYIFSKYILPAGWYRKLSLVGNKLSNYGDLHNIESDMDNRVAKSAALSLKSVYKLSVVKDWITAVKVQRVDGSWRVGNTSCLRCTLTGFVRNYQVKILSKQINKRRFFTTVNKTQEFNMNPLFLTGF